MPRNPTGHLAGGVPSERRVLPGPTPERGTASPEDYSRLVAPGAAGAICVYEAANTGAPYRAKRLVRSNFPYAVLHHVAAERLLTAC